MFPGDSGYGNVAFSELSSHVLSAQVFLFYCRIKGNVSKTDLVRQSESTVFRDFLYICFGVVFLICYFFWCWNCSLAQELFLAIECWVRALNLSVHHLNICIIIPHLLHKAVM